MSTLAITSPGLFAKPQRKNRLVAVPRPRFADAVNSSFTGFAGADQAARSLVKAPAPSVCVDQLVDHAISSMVDVMFERVGAIDDRLILASGLLVHAVTQDDGPTPQVSWDPGEGFTIEWLVNGASLTVIVHSEAEIQAWAEGASGEELFDYTITSKWSPADPAIVRMRSFLTGLATQIQERVPLLRIS